MTDLDHLADIRVLERGWLSSNNVLLLDDDEATLIDSGHVSHAQQSVALVRHALGGRRLARVINTHLHSDHCGGNAALQRTFDCDLWIPPLQWDAVMAWDEDALTYAPTGQVCERFVPQRAMLPGETLTVNGRTWLAMHAPGHDPGSLVLFSEQDGVLISADALWEHGFGVVFPELEGEAAFGEVAAVLDMIEALPVQLVIPGHGAPFRDVPAALERARQRLASFVADPKGHAWYAAKVLVKFELLDRQSVDYAVALDWAARTPYLATIHQRYFAEESLLAWCGRIFRSLCNSNAAMITGQQIVNL